MFIWTKGGVWKQKSKVHKEHYSSQANICKSQSLRCFSFWGQCEHVIELLYVETFRKNFGGILFEVKVNIVCAN